MLRLLVALVILAVTSPAFAEDKEKDKPKPNALTKREISDGWILLFDGETTFGWEATAKKKDDAKPELRVKDGLLVLTGEGRVRPTTALALFELRGEYRTAAKEAKLLVRTGSGVALEMGGALTTGKADEWRPFLVKFAKDETIIAAGDLSKPGISVTGGSLSDNALGEIILALPAGQNSSAELRNVKLRPLATAPLFTGKNLDGWKVNAADPKRMASKWEVTKDGELSVKNGPGDLVTEKEFDNFVLQFECKTLGKALNSGVFFRCIPGQYQNGYEAQIQNAFVGDDRTKPTDFGTGAIYRRVPARKVVSNDNEWFTMTVVADGKHISTWVNGYQTVDWTDDRKESDNPRQGYRAAKGPLSIQGHDPTTDILFRNIRIAPLP